MTRTRFPATFDLSGKTAPSDRVTARAGFADGACAGRGGAKVLLTTRKANDLQEAAAETQGRRHRGRLDCRRLRRARPILTDWPKAVQRLGHVVLINNAGAS